MTSSDELIGRNLARFRGDRSQKDVAESMRAFGWKWSQATVWAIERGDRPLRLAEAKDLAAVLDARSSDFLDTDEEATIDLALGSLNRLRTDLDQAIDSYTEALFGLAYAVDDSANPSDEARDWLSSETPVAVARRAGKFRTSAFAPPGNDSAAGVLAARLRDEA